MAEMEDVTKLIGEAIERYRPGGEFAETRAAQLAEKKRVALPEMEAGLVGRGLTGTTVAAAIPSRFEMEVGKPWETETAMLRSGRLMESILAKAGFMEREMGRDLQRELAQLEADLREKLTNKQITSQEYIARLQAGQKSITRRAGSQAGLSSQRMIDRWGAEREAAGQREIEKEREWAALKGGRGGGISGGGAQQHPGTYPSPFGIAPEDMFIGTPETAGRPGGGMSMMRAQELGMLGGYGSGIPGTGMAGIPPAPSGTGGVPTGTMGNLAVKAGIKKPPMEF